MDAMNKQRVIDLMDGVLVPHGFKFVKSRQLWKKKVDKANTTWIHLNVGHVVINPSFGVVYDDFPRLFPKELAVVTGTSEMLSSASGLSYSANEPLEPLARHLESLALPGLEVLMDRTAVIRNLQSSRAMDWPIYSASARRRMLPLLLVAEGRKEEAATWLAILEKDEGAVDQLAPRFPEFAAKLREHCGL